MEFEQLSCRSESKHIKFYCVWNKRIVKKFLHSWNKVRNEANAKHTIQMKGVYIHIKYINRGNENPIRLGNLLKWIEFDFFFHLGKQRRFDSICFLLKNYWRFSFISNERLQNNHSLSWSLLQCVFNQINSVQFYPFIQQIKMFILNIVSCA